LEVYLTKEKGDKMKRKTCIFLFITLIFAVNIISAQSLDFSSKLTPFWDALVLACTIAKAALAVGGFVWTGYCAVKSDPNTLIKFGGTLIGIALCEFAQQYARGQV
jgi:hypothetical protein